MSVRKEEASIENEMGIISLWLISNVIGFRDESFNKPKSMEFPCTSSAPCLFYLPSGEL
jgi:hypothetical protein